MNEIPDKKQIVADIERAKQLQGQIRRDAPAIGVKSPYQSPRKRQIARYVPDAWGMSKDNTALGGPAPFKVVGGTGATMAVHYTATENYREKVNRGWAPVVDEVGEVVQQNGDILMQRPMDITEREKGVSRQMSTDRVKFADAEMEGNAMAQAFNKLDPERAEKAQVAASGKV